MNNKIAIIIGASGLTGGLLLERLIADEHYASIKLFSRKSVNPSSPKVKEFIGDLLQLETFTGDFTGDEVYCCIGTTKSKTADQSIYKSIDYGIPVTAAKMAKQNGISTFMVVSAMGADATSSIFYNRTKGEMEEAVLNSGIENTYILRPSLITGNRTEKRLGEGVAKVVMTLFAPLMLGSLKKYRAIDAKYIATAMHKLSDIKKSNHIILSDEVKNIAVS